MATDPQDFGSVAVLRGAVHTPDAWARDKCLTFAEVFHRHGSGVLGLLRQLRVAEADVQDVAQEVFLAVHVRLPSFEGRSSLKTWIYSIALRKASDYRRKVRRRLESSEHELRACAQQAEQELEILHKQRLRLLEHALRTLPEKQLEVFVLYELEEMPMDEIAQAVGCPRFTAYSRLRTARATLSALFQDTLEDALP